MDEFPQRTDRVLIVYPTNDSALVHYTLSGLVNELMAIELDAIVINSYLEAGPSSYRQQGFVRVSPQLHSLLGKGWIANMQLPPQVTLAIVVTTDSGASKSQASLEFDSAKFAAPEVMIDGRVVKGPEATASRFSGQSFVVSTSRLLDGDELRLELRSVDSPRIFAASFTSHP